MSVTIPSLESRLLVNLSDYELLAQKLLPYPVWEYYRSGCGDDISLNDSIALFNHYRIIPRVLININHCDLKTTLLNNQIISFPLGIAPTALQSMANSQGEILTAKACNTLQTCFTVSSYSSTSIKDIASVSDSKCSHLWFQLYIEKNRNNTYELVKSAMNLGYKAIVITVDAQFGSNRNAVQKSHFQIPHPHQAVNLQNSNNYTSFAEINQHKALDFDWNELEEFVKHCPLPIILKGILSSADAIIACESRFKGIISAIWISNHGGRQLDSAIPSLAVLEEISTIVRPHSIEVYYDGGIRRGADIFKALALGATCCFIGRPVLWGLAVQGQTGIENVFAILRKELEICMRLAGCTSVKEISSNHVKLIANL